MNNELYHYGVKGMKWGVRRYQKKDGSFTPAGKKLYDRTTSNEDIAAVSTRGAYHRKKVMEKYESKKTESQRKADTARDNAWDNYQKYIENYSKSNRDTQTQYEHDFDHTKRGKRLLNAFSDASEVREKAYAGAEWYARYAKEMKQAADKDYREASR